MAEAAGYPVIDACCKSLVAVGVYQCDSIRTHADRTGRRRPGGYGETTRLYIHDAMTLVSPMPVHSEYIIIRWSLLFSCVSWFVQILTLWIQLCTDVSCSDICDRLSYTVLNEWLLFFFLVFLCRCCCCAECMYIWNACMTENWNKVLYVCHLKAHNTFFLRICIHCSSLHHSIWEVDSYSYRFS